MDEVIEDVSESLLEIALDEDRKELGGAAWADFYINDFSGLYPTMHDAMQPGLMVFQTDLWFLG